MKTRIYLRVAKGGKVAANVRAWTLVRYPFAEDGPNGGWSHWMIEKDELAATRRGEGWEVVQVMPVSEHDSLSLDLLMKLAAERASLETEREVSRIARDGQTSLSRALEVERRRTKALLDGIMDGAEGYPARIGEQPREALVSFRGITWRAAGATGDDAIAHLRHQIAEAVGLSLDAGEPEPSSKGLDDVARTKVEEAGMGDVSPSPVGEREAVARASWKQLMEFDAWLSFAPDPAEILPAFRKAFGTNTSATALPVEVEQDERPDPLGYVMLDPTTMGTEGGPRVAKVACFVGDKHVIFEPTAVRVDERDGPGRCGVEIPEETRHSVARLWADRSDREALIEKVAAVEARPGVTVGGVLTTAEISGIVDALAGAVPSVGGPSEEDEPVEMAAMREILADPEAAMRALPEAEQQRYREAQQSVVDARRSAALHGDDIVLGEREDGSSEAECDLRSLRRELATMLGPIKPREGVTENALWIAKVGDVLRERDEAREDAAQLREALKLSGDTADVYRDAMEKARASKLLSTDVLRNPPLDLCDKADSAVSGPFGFVTPSKATRARQAVFGVLIDWLDEHSPPSPVGGDDTRPEHMEATLYRCGECNRVASDDAWKAAWWRERSRRMGDPEYAEFRKDDPSGDYQLGDRMVCPHCQHVHHDGDDRTFVEEVKGFAVTEWPSPAVGLTVKALKQADAALSRAGHLTHVSAVPARDAIRDALAAIDDEVTDTEEGDDAND